MWEHAGVKTMLDLPDAALRQAKAVAADRGVTLKQFVTEALDEKLRRASAARTSGRNAEPPWMAGFGALADLRDENRRIAALIEDESEKLPAREYGLPALSNDPHSAKSISSSVSGSEGHGCGPEIS